MSQIKALNLSLIKGAAEVEHLRRIILLFRFTIIITRRVSYDIKLTESSFEQSTAQNTEDTLAQWEAGELIHPGMLPHLTQYMYASDLLQLQSQCKPFS